MKKGILLALIIYITGFGISLIIYLIFGHPYIHAPGFHHLMILLTLIIGAFWTLGSIFYFIFKEKTQKSKGFIITNIVIILFFIMYLSFDVNKSEENDNQPKNEVKTEIKRDTIRIYQNHNLVYLKIKDSIIINTIEKIK